MSGIATYERVPTSAAGLNYAATVVKPIRGAVVQVRQPTTPFTVLFTTTTASDGSFTITAPTSTAILLNVLASLGNPANPNTRVVDNTSTPADDDYAVYQNLTTGTGATTGVTLRANSGWNGTAYTSEESRVAAPFAILDTIYDAQRLVLSADPQATFPILLVGWSTKNGAATTRTSFYSPDEVRLSILGKADEDTDEFDEHVIAHEWGHFYEANFSRTDSLGGQHGSGDILDETVAFGEGFGNAFSGMVTRNPNYRDTSGPAQGATGSNFNLEADSISDSASKNGGILLDGGWSEFSVQELLFDLFDGTTAGVADTDSDGLALGFAPLHQTLVGAQKTTASFTSIYSFMYHLKAANPSAATAIDALLLAENIGPHDEFEQTTPGRRRYTTVPTDGTVVVNDVDGDPNQTYDDFGPITDKPGNKLLNRLLFKVNPTAAAALRFRATPITTTHDLVIYRGGGQTPNGIDAFVSGSETVPFNATAGTVYTFGVGSFTNAANATGITPFDVRCGTSAVVPQTPPTGPAMPQADG